MITLLAILLPWLLVAGLIVWSVRRQRPNWLRRREQGVATHAPATADHGPVPPE